MVTDLEFRPAETLANIVLFSRFDSAMETGDAGEGSLIGGGVGEIQDALNAERDGLHEAHIPMEMRAGEIPARVFGGIEAGLIDVDPQVGTPPDLREGTVYTRRA